MEVSKETGSMYPLYCESLEAIDPGDLDDAYLCLNCKNEKLYVCTESRSCNSWTPDEYYGFELSWPLDSYLTRDQVNELLEKVTPEAEKIIDGFYTKWDGHNNVACYDDDAKDAIAKIDDIVSPYSEDGVYPDNPDDFWDWYGGTGDYKVDPELKVCRIGSAEHPYPLFHEKWGEVSKAYLYLDICNEKLWVNWGEDDSEDYCFCALDVIPWEISPFLNYDRINELLDKVSPLAYQVLDGHFYDPEGHMYTDDAFAAMSKIEDICCDYYDEESDQDGFNRWLEKEENETVSS